MGFESKNVKDFKIEAKGRNGIFKLTDIECYAYGKNELEGGIAMFSKRSGDLAPIYFHGKFDDLTELLNTMKILANKVKKEAEKEAKNTA